MGNTGPMSQSTMTLKLSPKTSAKSQSSQRDILANPFQWPPASAKARQMTVTSGRGLLKSLSKQDPMYAFLRTLLVTSAWESTRCYLTWQLKVTMRGHAYLELSVKTPRTADNESGLLHTPTATANQMSPSMIVRDKGSWGMWPTPRAADVEGGIVQNVEYQNGSFSRKNKEGVCWGVKLRDAVNHTEKMWPTPRAAEYKDTGPVGSKSHKHMIGKKYLCAQVKDQEAPTAKLSSEWVELLMGYPPGWTEIGKEESPE